MSTFAAAAGLSPDQSLGESFEREFDALFGDYAPNRERIQLDLAKLVSFVGRGISMANRQDNIADFESQVYEHALQVLPRYLKRAAPRGKPAFNWFRKVINRKFWEITQRDLMVRKRSRGVESIDETGANVVDYDRMAMARRNKKPRVFRLTDPQDIQLAQRLLDLKITKCVRAFVRSRDEHERHVYQAIILSLQEIRAEQLGSFKPIMTQGVEYRKHRRHHGMTTPARKRRVKRTELEKQAIKEREIPLWTLPN